MMEDTFENQAQRVRFLEYKYMLSKLDPRWQKLIRVEAVTQDLDLPEPDREVYFVVAQDIETAKQVLTGWCSVYNRRLLEVHSWAEQGSLWVNVSNVVLTASGEDDWEERYGTNPPPYIDPTLGR